MTPKQKFAHNRQINALANDLAALPIPTVVAMNGIAMGGGVELPLACDIRFASKSAKIGLTEARLGAMPGAGGSQRLPRLIGTARALEMMYSGEPISAAQAADWGLVNRVVPDDALQDAAREFVMLLSKRARRTTQLLKEAVYQGMDKSLEDGLVLEGQAISEVLASQNYAEGLAAFEERREPKLL